MRKQGAARIPLMPRPSKHETPMKPAPTESGEGRAEVGHGAPDMRVPMAAALERFGSEREAVLSDHMRAREGLNRGMVALASEARDAGLSAAEIASALGISRARLYQLVGKAGDGNE